MQQASTWNDSSIMLCMTKYDLWTPEHTGFRISNQHDTITAKTNAPCLPCQLTGCRKNSTELLWHMNTWNILWCVTVRRQDNMSDSYSLLKSSLFQASVISIAICVVLRVHSGSWDAQGQARWSDHPAECCGVWTLPRGRFINPVRSIVVNMWKRSSVHLQQSCFPGQHLGCFISIGCCSVTIEYYCKLNFERSSGVNLLSDHEQIHCCIAKLGGHKVTNISNVRFSIEHTQNIRLMLRLLITMEILRCPC